MAEPAAADGITVTVARLLVFLLLYHQLAIPITHVHTWISAGSLFCLAIGCGLRGVTVKYAMVGCTDLDSDDIAAGTDCVR